MRSTFVQRELWDILFARRAHSADVSTEGVENGIGNRSVVEVQKLVTTLKARNNNRTAKVQPIIRLSV